MKEMNCRFSDGPVDGKVAVNPIGEWHKPWFFTHVEAIGKINKVRQL